MPRSELDSIAQFLGTRSTCKSASAVRRRLRFKLQNDPVKRDQVMTILRGIDSDLVTRPRITLNAYGFSPFDVNGVRIMLAAGTICNGTAPAQWTGGYQRRGWHPNSSD
jgi:hypothetical protein